MLVSIYCSYTAVLISSKTKEGASDKVDLTSAGGSKAGLYNQKETGAALQAKSAKHSSFQQHTHTHIWVVLLGRQVPHTQLYNTRRFKQMSQNIWWSLE